MLLKKQNDKETGCPKFYTLNFSIFGGQSVTCFGAQYDNDSSRQAVNSFVSLTLTQAEILCDICLWCSV